jgi:alkylation response protein AidB-like acyl-CoA dehydrogenase
MKLEFNSGDEAFRQEVRQFLRKHLPVAMAERTYCGFTPPLKRDLQDWNRILFERGWAAPHWPVEYGGTGWSALQQHIFEEECHLAYAPDLSWQGLRLLAPVLYTYGSDEQKARYLPPILRGDTFWAQGFSEPNAGSDLVSLKTQAVRQGDHYIVNGQKTWSSEGHYADWGFFLVRTDLQAKPQRGISFLLIDLKTPGITVRPIIMFNGAHYVNEIFLDNVVVPAENLVGEEGKGWSYTKFLLEHERASSAFIYFSKRELQHAREIARLEMIDGVPLIEVPEFAAKLACTEMDLLALEWSVLRVLANERSRYDQTAIASGLKIRGSELQQRITELTTEFLGARALRDIAWYDDAVIGDTSQVALWPRYVPGRMSTAMHTRAVTIYGGAKEVQKNIIAKLAFGL